MSERKSMSDIFKQIEKQHGSADLFVGNTESVIEDDVLSTGSYALDDALGIGGFPRAGIIHLAGAQSSGKTMLALSTIAQWQKKDPSHWAVFIDAEYTFDPKWATSLGCDVDRIMVYRENRGAQVFEFLVGQPDPKKTGQKKKKGLLDLEIENGGTGLGIIALDSIACLQPPLEEASEVGKANMALLARFLPPELRRLTPLLAQTKISLIAINQIRDTMAMYGDPTSSPGGRALAHANMVMVNFGRITGQDSKIEVNGEQIGHHVRARVEKNKRSAPFKVAEFAIEYTKGVVNHENELRILGCKYGIISKPNNKTYIYNGVSYNGKGAMSLALQSPDIQHEIWEKIKEAKKTWTGNTNDGDETTNNETEE